MNPTTNRGREWRMFSSVVLKHIEDYTVPQYGDRPDDNVSEWRARDCMVAIKKYVNRFGNNQREGQELMDMKKIAHYACIAYWKIVRGDKPEEL